MQGITNISVQSSTSLQHLPYNKDLETELPADLVARLSFAKQKVAEIVEAASKAPSAAAPASLIQALPTVGECLNLACVLAWHVFFFSQVFSFGKMLPLPVTPPCSPKRFPLPVSALIYPLPASDPSGL
jgi:hypothetical protein